MGTGCVHSFTHRLWLLSRYNGRGGYLRQRLQSLKYLLSGALEKMFADSCSREREHEMGNLNLLFLFQFPFSPAPPRVSILLG